MSTSAVVFLGFRISRKGPTERYPYGLDRAEDLAGIGIAVVIWASAVAPGFRWGDLVAGIAVTAFICHVGYEVTADVVRRLADSVDPDLLTTVETAVAAMPVIEHAHARARWTRRALRIEVEGWVDPGLTVSDADTVGQLAAQAVSEQLPEMTSFTFSARPSPSH